MSLQDQELWQQDGDCLVHLYAQGRSQRGASFRTTCAEVELAVGQAFLTTYLAPEAASYDESPSTSSKQADYDLYIAAPENVTREDAYSWHITTRNIFAYIANKPLVGSQLGRTLVAVLERIQLFCPDKTSSTRSFLSYLQTQGYLNFVNHPMYALASLNFAEHMEQKDLWIDAFSHCVGMNDQLDFSPEFNDISRTTKALITRSYLEMDLHLGRVSRALRTFLEEELAPAHLGLPKPARNHLDRFRSFMQSYYVNKLGYWPPRTGNLLDKSLLRSMKQDFQMLYDYLVDGESSSTQPSSKLTSGGICVTQNIEAFNTRHNYEPLPHPAPLLPDYGSLEYRTSSQKGLRSLKLTPTKSTKAEQSMTARTALSTATNKVKHSSPLVRNYMYFESEQSFRPEEKLSIGDARKVRWIAIYAILQMLTNALRAPKEVVDAKTTPYHLCLLTTGLPHWYKAGGTVSTTLSVPSTRAVLNETEGSDKAVSSIHPDCEDNDYFSHKMALKRQSLDASLRPQPLCINTGGSLNRHNSIRSLQKTFTSNFSFPSRRLSLRLPVVSSATFGNPIDLLESPGATSSASPVNRRLSGFSFAINEEETVNYLNPLQPEPSFSSHLQYASEARTPTLDFFMLDPHAISSTPTTPMSTSSFSDSPVSLSSNMWGSTSSNDNDDTSSLSSSTSSHDIDSMDHESIHSNDATTHARKPSTTSLCRLSSNLSSLTTASAAAATAKLYQEHTGLMTCEQQAAHLPSWWSTSPQDNNNSRAASRSSFCSSTAVSPSFAKLSVPQHVPEDHAMAFERTSDGQSLGDLVSTVNFFDAMHVLNHA
jgi:hypothetical protein